MNTTNRVVSILFTLSICILPNTDVNAEVILDGSLGTAGPLDGPDYLISAELGQQSGGNLFHSFQTFNVNSLESATFTGPTSVDNIINRVTGGEISWIDGPFRSTIPSANLYFINPAGITFGPNASLDIDGAFHVSTADYLTLGENNRFDATLPENSLLSSAPPAAFGFLDAGAMPIVVEGELWGTEEKSFSIVGGEINITGGLWVENGGTLSVTSVASPGEKPIWQENVDDFSELGKISVRDMGYIQASGPSSGNLFIRSESLVMDAGTISIYNTGVIDDGVLDIRVSDEIEMSGRSLVKTYNESTGNSADLTVEADRLLLTEKSKISVNSFGPGDGGTLSVSVSELILDENSHLATFTTDFGIGGALTVEANDLQLTNNAAILSLTEGAMAGGSIEINAAQLSLYEAAQIGTVTTGNGQAGNLKIKADGQIIVAGQDDQGYSSTLYSETSGAGANGVIEIISQDLNILEEGRILSTRTKDGGQRSDTILDTDSLHLNLNGKIVGGNINIDVGSIHLENGSFIWGQPSGGEEINVNIQARESLHIIGQGQEISPWRSNSTPLYTGIHTDVFYERGTNAGNIFLESPRITIQDSGQIGARTYSDNQAGDIEIIADQITLTNGGQIATDSFGSSIYYGPAGNIKVMANESINISGSNWEVGSGFFSTTRSDASAGHIQIDTPELQISDRGSVTVSTGVFGEGSAGVISINVDHLKLTDSGSISNSSPGYGTEGSINITASEDVYINGSWINSSSTRSNGGFSSGSAGDIYLKTPNFIMENGKILSETDSVTDGGDITIDTDNFQLNNDSLLTTTSYSIGNAGNIFINANSSFTLYDSSLTTETTSSAGGGISLTSNDLFHLQNSEISTSVQGGSGDGGNISIDPTFVILDNSDIIANAHDGRGGNIDIVANYFFAWPNNTIEASSELGIDGTIEIDTPEIDISGSMVLLPDSKDVPGLALNVCTNRNEESISSLVVHGQGGVRPSPEDLYLSDRLAEIKNHDNNP